MLDTLEMMISHIFLTNRLPPQPKASLKSDMDQLDFISLVQGVQLFINFQFVVKSGTLFCMTASESESESLDIGWLFQEIKVL